MNNFSIVKRKFQSVLKYPELLLLKPLVKFSKLFSDELFVKLNFKLRMGQKLSLRNPKTYNEKLQWLKLYYHNPELTKMVDKYESKKYVASLVGDKYVIPTIAVYNDFSEISFDELPNQFVLKTTHDQGGVVICKNKDLLDINKAKIKIEKHLNRNHYYISREWPYKNIKPRIIVEEYMEDITLGELADYKFFCFNGDPKALFIATERQRGKVKFDYFDIDFNHLDLKQNYDQSSYKIHKPKNYDEMVKIARILSSDLPHVRVDLYEINGSVYFGELTFFHHGGHTPFYPHKWDLIWGDWINLPEKTG